MEITIKTHTFAPGFSETAETSETSETAHTEAPGTNDPLAQQVEHNTFNVGVLGSSPKRITLLKDLKT